MAKTNPDDTVDRAADALLLLAAEASWREISLRQIAERAGVALADLYPRADGKTALLAHLSARYDKAALATAATPSQDVHDRLFDAVMARVEAMEPNRAALIAIARGGGALALVPHFPRTARAILEVPGSTPRPPGSRPWRPCGPAPPRSGATTKALSIAPWPKSTNA